MTQPTEATQATPPIRGHVLLHFAGAGAVKLAPPVVQATLLALVARDGSLTDVGVLALGSAVAFLCGALAELGLGTSLSISTVAFGTEAPPLRATRGLRVGAALAGSALYVLLWAAGLGDREPVLLLVAPLPWALALSLGYGATMNASAMLRYEIPVSIGESVLILALTVVGSLAVPMLTAALAALTIGRLIGTAARMLLTRRVPQSTVARLPRVHLTQAPFALATIGWVVQGQAELVVLGFLAPLTLTAVYAPLLRTAYSTLLAAEGLTWGLMGEGNPDHRPAETAENRLARRWRSLLLAGGLLLAVAFVVLAEPFLHLLLDRDVGGLGPAIGIFGVVIVTRFGSLTAHVDIIRAGRQRSEVPVLWISAAVLVVASAIAAIADSITGLALARLASEVAIALGFIRLHRQLAVMGGGARPRPDLA